MAIWLGKWSKNKTKPLQLQWVNEPVKILGVYFSYDENKNKLYNFDLKIQKLQTKLDLWKARNLTLFGKALIIKSLGLSQIVYAASNVNVLPKSNKQSRVSYSNSSGTAKMIKLREKVYIKITIKVKFA